VRGGYVIYTIILPPRNARHFENQNTYAKRMPIGSKPIINSQKDYFRKRFVTNITITHHLHHPLQQHSHLHHHLHHHQLLLIS
jgi:hypothetical protein